METSMINTYSKDNLKKAHYVVVELCPKDKPADRTLGLFMGINPVVKVNTALAGANELFVFLWKDPIIHMLNLDRYGIKSIEIGGSGNTMVSQQFFAASDNDQCIEKLKLIQEAMKESGKTMDGDLVDVDKYIVPKSVTDKIKNARSSIPSVTTPASKAVDHNRSSGVSDWHGANHPAACGYNGYTGTASTYVNKIVNTTWIQRSSKYPIEAAMQRMRSKIAEIKAGTYVPPQLPEIPADKKEKEAADEKKVVLEQSDSKQAVSNTDDNQSTYQRRLKAMGGYDEEDVGMWAGMM